MQISTSCMTSSPLKWFCSELPEDEWFTEMCQDAMDKLSGKPKVAANGEPRDLNSPTASVSAQSVSSVRSY